MLRGARKAFSRYLEEVKRATALRHYDYKESKILWDFTKDDTLAGWDCICDQDIHGKSTAVLENNGKGTGVAFRGCLSTELPSDPKVKYSGYCAIRSKPLEEDWYDKGRIDVSEYDAFELRVCSDGRRFIANITAPTLGRKDDVWQCFVYTRGGPEWENIRLQFADFFVTHRGYMQDSAFSFPQSSVETFGLLMADKVNGPFELEIQHIKAVRSLVAPLYDSRGPLFRY